MKNNLLILDVETGGRDAQKNPITQLALQVVEPIKFSTLHRFEIIVKPYNNLIIEKDAINYTRVTMDQIQRGEDVTMLIKGVVQACKVANPSGKDVTAPIVVGHNVGFDIRFLDYLFTYKGKNLFDFIGDNPFDTLSQCKLLEAGALKSADVNSYRLTTCCERWGITLKSAHGAPADVEATRLLMKQIILQSRKNKTSQDDNDEHEHGRPATRSRDNFKFEF